MVFATLVVAITPCLIPMSNIRPVALARGDNELWLGVMIQLPVPSESFSLRFCCSILSDKLFGPIVQRVLELERLSSSGRVRHGTGTDSVIV